MGSIEKRYAILTKPMKLKTPTAMNKLFSHNFRIKEVPNAAESLLSQNREVVPILRKVDGDIMSYYEAYQERIKELPYYQDHQVRSNAVPLISFVTEYSEDANGTFDNERWIQKNEEWFRKIFDVAPDGKSNIVSMVYHGDEVGNNHCHVVIIPIDENGKLNASRFIDGNFAELYTDYAEAMSEFGLRRGQENSRKHYYSDLNRLKADTEAAMVLPPTYPGQSAEEYVNEFEEELKTARAVHKKELNEAQKQMESEYTDFCNQQYAEIQRNYQTSIIEIEERRKEEEKRIKQLLELRGKDTDEILEMALKYEEQQKVFSYVKERDPEFYEVLEQLIDQAEAVYESQESEEVQEQEILEDDLDWQDWGETL